MSVVKRIGLGLFLIAEVALLGGCYRLVKPSAPAREFNSRTSLVAVNLEILHLLISGFMADIGILPTLVCTHTGHRLHRHPFTSGLKPNALHARFERDFSNKLENNPQYQARNIHRLDNGIAK